MEQIIEFAGNHPFLIAAAVILIVLVIVNEVRMLGGPPALGPNEAIRLSDQGGVMIDLRGVESYRAGHIVKARNIPLASLSEQLAKLKKYKEKPVIVYCESGLESAKAASLLTKAGFAQVARLRGGLKAWRQENMPVVIDNKG